jgi:pilus assembly protein FimV
MLPATADDMRFEVSDFAAEGPPSGLPPVAPAHLDFTHAPAAPSSVTPFPGLPQVAAAAGAFEPHAEAFHPSSQGVDFPPVHLPTPAPEVHESHEVAHEGAQAFAHNFAQDFAQDFAHQPVVTPVLAPAAAELPPLPAAARSEEATPSGMAPAIDFDFGDLSLDLDAPATKAAPETTSHGSEFTLSGTDSAAMPDLDLPALDTNEPMARKIELADEFRRIGDHEGARELLEEVLAKAEGPLRSRAQTMLDALG